MIINPNLFPRSIQGFYVTPNVVTNVHYPLWSADIFPWGASLIWLFT